MPKPDYYSGINELRKVIFKHLMILDKSFLQQIWLVILQFSILVEITFD